MQEIGDKSIDLILADLPYSITRNQWDSIIPFEDLWRQYERIIKDKGIIVLTAAQPFTSQLLMSNPKMFKYSLVWNKNITTGFLNAKKMPLRQHEDILIFYKRLGTYNPQFTDGKPYVAKRKNPATDSYNYFRPVTTVNTGLRYPTSIINIPAVNNFSNEKCKHPTQKPVALFEYLIKTYTNEGDLVLDNCAGSFTTAIACDNTKRNWICIEKDESYYSAGIDRINNNRKRLKELVYGA